MITKARIRKLNDAECFMYQLIESSLKIDLDPITALKCINLILDHYRYYFNTDNYVIKLGKINYRNYRRYIKELKKMSLVHKKFYKEMETIYIKDDPTNAAIKPHDMKQFENLLFLLNINNSKLPYHRIKRFDTDDLIFNALIQIDKSYIF